MSVERYTKRLDDGQAAMDCEQCKKICGKYSDDCSVLRCRNRLKDRVAAYEDTGLEPQEIEKIRQDVEAGFLEQTARRYGVDVDRIRELVKADRDGRCVVLPCKTGDTVWFNTYSCNATVCHGVQPHKVKAIRTYVIVAGDHTDVGLPIETAGITWFLTENAARDALKGDTNG